MDRRTFLAYAIVPLYLTGLLTRSAHRVLDDTRLSVLDGSTIANALSATHIQALLAVLSLPHWLYLFVWTNPKGFIALTKKAGFVSPVECFANAAHALKVLQMASLLAYVVPRASVEDASFAFLSSPFGCYWPSTFSWQASVSPLLCTAP